MSSGSSISLYKASSKDPVCAFRFSCSFSGICSYAVPLLGQWGWIQREYPNAHGMIDNTVVLYM